MSAPVFLVVCIAALAMIFAVLGESTSTRNDRTLGNVGCAFDWIVIGGICGFIILALMGATLQAASTGQPFENPMQLSPENTELWKTFWAHVFGLD